MFHVNYILSNADYMARIERSDEQANEKFEVEKNFAESKWK